MTPPASTLVLATTNPGKAAEFRALLGLLLDLARVKVVTPADHGTRVPPVEESGVTFGENARLKALAYAAATGLPSLADDSGLCVDALGGAPGLFSARWAGAGASDADRVALLLRELRGVPDADRAARFVCAAALATPDGVVGTAEGVCHGVITLAPRGEDGFGYDPVFAPPEGRGHTLSEMSPGEKNRISHRALAINELLPCLLTLGFSPRSAADAHVPSV